MFNTCKIVIHNFSRSNSCANTPLKLLVIKRNINTNRQSSALSVLIAADVARVDRKSCRSFNSAVIVKRCASIQNRPKCWNCGKENNKSANAIFCKYCNTIQEPNRNNNYFEVIGIGEHYDLDEGSLSVKYKNLQRLLHPDKFSIRSESEQKISAEYSALVNKAYSTLIEPLARGIYLLRLKGQEISEETQVESKFLHEIMERNEEVESAETPEEILKINEENKERISELVKKLAFAFDSNDLESARNILIHMKYFVSIENLIKENIRRMQIVE